MGLVILNFGEFEIRKNSSKKKLLVYALPPEVIIGQISTIGIIIHDSNK
jgi:hypothetical protein